MLEHTAPATQTTPPATPPDPIKLAALVLQFKRDLERRQQRDADVLASLARAIRNPRGLMRADLAVLDGHIRAIVRQEMKGS